MKKVSKVAIKLLSTDEEKTVAKNIIEGALIGLYKFDKYKTYSPIENISSDAVML